ncbi:hypothetical protein EVAR_48082_1 [Eumeta japonica]|uniref:Uncharacterized protein n=1 Tax=Eumeta variegata TaxID=151549 RepID=A0A4C1XMR8_EUMVA|nr:hypothetical protein EVAR_48082_1 [Eumeta japonica]
MSIEYELIDESDPDPLGKIAGHKSTRTAAKLMEGSDGDHLVDERYRIEESLPGSHIRHRSMNRKDNEETPQLRRLQLTQNPKRIPKTRATTLRTTTTERMLPGRSSQGPEEISGSERLRKQIKLKGDKNREARASREQRSETETHKGRPREVKPPSLCLSRIEKTMRNAFLEFAALTIAIQDVTQTMCKHSAHIQEGDIEQLKRKFEKTKAPYTTISRPNIYSETQDKTWRPTMTGLVYLDEQATKITGKTKYKTQKTINGNERRHKGAEAATRVRTMAILVNGFKEHTHNRLPNHSDKCNKWPRVAGRGVVCDVREVRGGGYHAREPRRRRIYRNIYSTQEGTRPLTMDGYDRNKLSISLPQTLYQAHTQTGKAELKAMGYGQDGNKIPGHKLGHRNNQTPKKAGAVLTGWVKHRIKAKKGVNLETKRTNKWRSTHNDIPVHGVRADGLPGSL